jgi:hypothetical protein
LHGYGLQVRDGKSNYFLLHFPLELLLTFLELLPSTLLLCFHLVHLVDLLTLRLTLNLLHELQYGVGSITVDQNWSFTSVNFLQGDAFSCNLWVFECYITERFDLVVLRLCSDSLFNFSVFAK